MILEQSITFLNLLVMYLKRTKYYDLDTDTEESYFHTELESPWDAI